MNQWWLVYRRIYASLGLNELTNLIGCSTRMYVDATGYEGKWYIARYNRDSYFTLYTQAIHQKHFCMSFKWTQSSSCNVCHIFIYNCNVTNILQNCYFCNYRKADSWCQRATCLYTFSDPNPLISVLCALTCLQRDIPPCIKKLGKVRCIVPFPCDN